MTSKIAGNSLLPKIFLIPDTFPSQELFEKWLRHCRFSSPNRLLWLRNRRIPGWQGIHMETGSSVASCRLGKGPSAVASGVTYGTPRRGISWSNPVRQTPPEPRIRGLRSIRKTSRFQSNPPVRNPLMSGPFDPVPRRHGEAGGPLDAYSPNPRAEDVPNASRGQPSGTGTGHTKASGGWLHPVAARDGAAAVPGQTRGRPTPGGSADHSPAKPVAKARTARPQKTVSPNTPADTVPKPAKSRAPVPATVAKTSWESWRLTFDSPVSKDEVAKWLFESGNAPNGFTITHGTSGSGSEWDVSWARWQGVPEEDSHDRMTELHNLFTPYGRDLANRALLGGELTRPEAAEIRASNDKSSPANCDTQ